VTEAFREELASQIEQAFANTPYPENGDVGYELEDIEGLHWKEVPTSLLRAHRDELSSFTPEGFRFFLPALLIAVILHPDQVDTLTWNIIGKLAPPEPESDIRAELFDFLEITFRQRVSVLSPEEKAAVRAFVEAYDQLEPLDDGGYYTWAWERAWDFWTEE
jgi:hypothetical protein